MITFSQYRQLDNFLNESKLLDFSGIDDFNLPDAQYIIGINQRDLERMKRKALRNVVNPKLKQRIENFFINLWDLIQSF